MEKRRVAQKWIKKLEKDEIFVFGSNLAGAHGGGAARLAMQWGADLEKSYRYTSRLC